MPRANFEKSLNTETELSSGEEKGQQQLPAASSSSKFVGGSLEEVVTSREEAVLAGPLGSTNVMDLRGSSPGLAIPLRSPNGWRASVSTTISGALVCSPQAPSVSMSYEMGCVEPSSPEDTETRLDEDICEKPFSRDMLHCLSEAFPSQVNHPPPNSHFACADRALWGNCNLSDMNGLPQPEESTLYRAGGIDYFTEPVTPKERTVAPLPSTFAPASSLNFSVPFAPAMY